MLDKGTEGVAVGSDQNLLAALDGRHASSGPPGKEAVDRVFQALGGRHILAEILVAGVLGRPKLVVLLHQGGGNVVGAPPHVDLVCAVLLHSLLLVEALEAAVVALVEAPGLLDGDPEHAHVLQNGQACLDGTLQHRRVHNVKRKALLAKVLGSAVSLRNARVGKGNVDPASEAVLLVPGALAVPHEHEGVVPILIEAIVASVATDHLLDSVKHPSSPEAEGRRRHGRGASRARLLDAGRETHG
mmetsp:Transcript_7985/g.18517  ORF Transcript_7985/g.18517 Transcript_7985/m.18517 type:complete len:244 (-) Transcript_7985:66-797(-)